VQRGSWQTCAGAQDQAQPSPPLQLARERQEAAEAEAEASLEQRFTEFLRGSSSEEGSSGAAVLGPADGLSGWGKALTAQGQRAGRLAAGDGEPGGGPAPRAAGTLLAAPMAAAKGADSADPAPPGPAQLCAWVPCSSKCPPSSCTSAWRATAFCWDLQKEASRWTAQPSRPNRIETERLQ